MMDMSETILKEADILWKALATGAVLILVYDFLRIIRKLVPHGTVWIAVEDILFWAGSAVAVFAMLCRENDGYLRGFSIGGVALGMILYSVILSPLVVKGSVFLLEKILFFLLRPLVPVLKLLRKAVKIGRSKNRKFGRFLKKQLKKAWKTVKMSLCKL